MLNVIDLKQLKKDAYTNYPDFIVKYLINDDIYNDSKLINKIIKFMINNKNNGVIKHIV